MSKRLYMHTVDGKPARYDKEQGYIYFVHQWSRVKASEMFVASLSTIRRQQAADKKWRDENLYGAVDHWKLGYIVVTDDRDE